MALSDKAALVLFSGGQDSATCLAWALDRYRTVETIGFSYGQRHSVELACRKTVLKELSVQFPHWGNRLCQDHEVDLGVLGSISDTALTRNVEIEMATSGLPTTFVPGRNILFLTFAACVAYRRGLSHIIGGMCETDFSGYPDCRDDAIKALQVALNIGMDQRFVIQTPLMWIDKAETWKLAQDLGGLPFIELIKEHTHTCYQGDRKHRHVWGYGCGKCPACELRAEGYKRFSHADDVVAR